MSFPTRQTFPRLEAAAQDGVYPHRNNIRSREQRKNSPVRSSDAQPPGKARREWRVVDLAGASVAVAVAQRALGIDDVAAATFAHRVVAGGEITVAPCFYCVIIEGKTKVVSKASLLGTPSEEDGEA